jgi:hypothetical protein
MGVATTRMPYRSACEHRRIGIAVLRSMSMEVDDIDRQAKEAA